MAETSSVDSFSLISPMITVAPWAAQWREYAAPKPLWEVIVSCCPDIWLECGSDLILELVIEGKEVEKRYT